MEALSPAQMLRLDLQKSGLCVAAMECKAALRDHNEDYEATRHYFLSGEWEKYINSRPFRRL